MIAVCLLAVLGTPDARTDVGKVLDAWHAAAARADEPAYFSHFAAQAVFLGTDATERWNKDEFRKFAHPYFARGKAWSFKSTRRAIMFSKDGNVAWFDEDLDTPNMGPCRGSGVLVMEDGAWRIAHYNLALTIPNEKLEGVKKLLAGDGK